MNKRIQSIDILRGITIFLMVMSANIAWSAGLPGWMFHCQVPPPDYVFNPDIKGITWVDLVFPFFIFSMGASMPFSLGGKLRKGQSIGQISAGIIKRWLILAAFGLVLGNAGLVSSYTDTSKVLLRLGIWTGMFLSLWRIDKPKGWMVNTAGALSTAALLLIEKRAFGVTLSAHSNDIIIMILSLLALLGGFIWLVSRDRWVVRALILLAVCALKEITWHSDCLNWADFPGSIKWLFSWGYAQYLVILIAGMSVGDIISRARERGECQFASARRPSSIVTAIGSIAIIPLILRTMYTRDIFTGMYLTLGFGIITIILLRGDYRSPANIIVKAGYLLLALGIAFDPIDGGMTKDYCNLSYMLTTSGLACLLLYFLLWLEALLSKAGKSISGGFTLTGQNPMLAYTLSGFILNPLFYIIGLGAVVDGACAGNPLMGFVRGLIISFAMLALTSLFSKKKYIGEVNIMYRKILSISLALSLLAGCATVRSSAPLSGENIISGSVKDDSGRPVAGVVVSDGVSVVKTDTAGAFTMPYDRASGRFVFVSTPSGYRSATFRGPACYYQDMKSDKKVYDFTLIKNTFDDRRSKAIVFADPQIQDTSDLRPFDKRVDDIKEHIKQFKEDEYTFGICLGDMVGWQHLLYPRITGKIGELGIDMRYVIGNHDMTNYGRSYETSFREFEKFYGPTYYSFNVGDEHYIVLNDNFYVGRDYFYIGYLDEVQLSWLEKDLAFTPRDKKVVLCLHIPTTIGKADRDNFRYDVISDNLCNKTALYSMLSGHDAIILSGHMHTNTNFVIGTGKGRDGLMEHNLGGFCGTWWCGTVCADGCPPGYKVYSFDGTDMRWYYKSCTYGPDFQGKLYLDHGDYPGLAVAHVWDYDPSWKVEYYEDGVKICDMTRFTGKDPVAKEEFTDASKHKIPWVACLPTPNLFEAPYNASAKHHEVRITDRFGGVHTVSD